MNWGKKITLAYLSFVALMVFMVYMCFQQKDIFLVTENYYEAELAYEDVIVKKQNARALSSEVGIDFVDVGVGLDFPQECVGSKGTVTFYRPSSSNLDVVMPLDLTSATSQVFPTGGMTGNYLLKIDWTQNGKGYYVEEKLTL